MATAGAPEMPDPWRLQLSSRGRIVAPIGPRSGQVLIVATRRPDGSLDIREGTPCAFVPLIGARAWPGYLPRRRPGGPTLRRGATCTPALRVSSAGPLGCGPSPPR